MKKLLLLLIVFAWFNFSYAEDISRVIIEDKAGVKTELTNVHFTVFYNMDRNKFLYSGNPIDHVVLSIKSFDVAIPFSKIISIERKANLLEINYIWKNKEVVITGEPVRQEELIGKSDFGDYKIYLADVKKLINKKHETNGKYFTSSKNDPFQVTLNDGSVMFVYDLQRFGSYYSSAGYLVGGTTIYKHYSNFQFQRGKSTATVDFEKIKTIEFLGEDNVSITLKNNKIVSGTFAADIHDGFSGIFDRGFVFIGTSDLKSITFPNKRTTINSSRPKNRCALFGRLN